MSEIDRLIDEFSEKTGYVLFRMLIMTKSFFDFLTLSEIKKRYKNKYGRRL